ncbi:penicillin-binding transpeptidase domain-containing protein, partial [Caballeronia sp. M23-90]
GGNADVVRAFVRETPQYRAAKDAGQTDADILKHLNADRPFMQALCDNKTRVQAAFLAIDPRNGQVKAWVGSRDFSTDPFDHVQQARRQPGSTFKPFVYGAAFAQGSKPDDTLVDQAVEIPLAGGEIWRPNDETPPSGRPVTLRDGLAYSRNRITAQLVQNVGPYKVARLARAMGVRDSPLDAVPSLALGTSPVTLKEMVASYGTIANGGARIEPMLVTRIENRKGEVLAQFAPNKPEQALSPAADHELLDVMRDVVNRGTGTAIRNRFGIRADVAGKTGTTQDNADGWFILMHPQLVAGAWVGFNDSRVTLRSDYWGQGAHSALPIVGDFFQRSLRNRMIDPRERFVMEPQTGFFESMRNRLHDWYQRVFAPKPEPKAAPVKRNPPRRTAPPVVAKAPASSSAPQPPILQPPHSEPSDIRDEGFAGLVPDLAPTIDPASASAAP